MDEGTGTWVGLALMLAVCASPAAGLPRWGPDQDWNVQCDTGAALAVARSEAVVTMVTLPVTLKAHLREADVERLARSGPLGKILARQAIAHGAENAMHELAGANIGLPGDLLNFQYDPVACAVALGWPGAVVEWMRLRPSFDGDVLRFSTDDAGRWFDVVVDIHGHAFAERWLTAVEAAQAGP